MSVSQTRNPPTPTDFGSAPYFSDVEIQTLSTSFEHCTAAEIVYWAASTYGTKLAITTSLQTQSLPLLHLVSRICPNTKVVFLDTGFHFEETLHYMDLLSQRLHLPIERVVPRIGHAGFREKYGELHRTDPEMCCFINKVEPLQQTLKGHHAWISGIRRDQTPQRANTPVLSSQSNGLIKVCPLVTWTAEDVEIYIEKMNLPPHPLQSQGYLSIGCKPCSKSVPRGEDPRAGRWAGTAKTECGLHFDSKEGRFIRSPPSSPPI